MAADLIRIAGFVTPLGPFAVAVSPSGVVATGTPDRLPEALGEAGLHFAEDPDGLPEIGADLDAYFAGRIRGLPEPVDLRLAPTPFIRQVLEVACRIPYGELRTYGDVARSVAPCAVPRSRCSCPATAWFRPDPDGAATAGRTIAAYGSCGSKVPSDGPFALRCENIGACAVPRASSSC
jgi:hypothetical protein